MDDDKVFVDGRCLSECPENTALEFQTEAICVRETEDNKATTDKGNDSNEEKVPIFQVDWIV